jgi:hypothetical protein
MTRLYLLVLPILSLTIFPKPVGKVLRLDRQGGPYSNSFQAVVLDAWDAKSSIPADASSKALLGSDAFDVRIKCPNLNQTLCDKAKKAMISAGDRIAQVLTIRKRITVDVTFRSFCGGRPCGLSNRLGQASYGSAFVVRKGNGYYKMSQALVKQHMTDVSADLALVDIEAEFNADHSWYFREENNQDIVSGQMDFEYVAVHELTHGIGFGSAMQLTQSAQGSFLSTSSISKNESVPGSMSYMEPIDIYDSFIWGNGKSFKSLGSRITSLGMHNVSGAGFENMFQSNETVLQAAKEAYEIATKGEGQLFFNATDGTSFLLYSPNPYQPGSSLHHLDVKNSETEDFIMIPGLPSGVTLEKLMARTNMTTIYGKKIKKVLESIGWATIDKPEMNVIQLALNYGVLGSSSRLGISLLLLALPIIVLSL